jgi:hypothetical protein
VQEASPNPAARFACSQNRHAQAMQIALEFAQGRDVALLNVLVIAAARISNCDCLTSSRLRGHGIR